MNELQFQKLYISTLLTEPEPVCSRIGVMKQYMFLLEPSAASSPATSGRLAELIEKYNTRSRLVIDCDYKHMSGDVRVFVDSLETMPQDLERFVVRNLRLPDNNCYHNIVGLWTGAPPSVLSCYIESWY